ncbi:MAG: peptide chain release factor 2 [Hyphomicrobium sp.]|uniref:peptide chain release factor 2 n=1 Tax=Hyphomicrobium sp. TaxID=82 RepID=UPI00132526BA|nr:peptide chain release factor 2 [Hyphomicrobium sp.]KAB2940655.1 MAG: peptide chain release factor 2 [Hyphomicrobium sp.]MBZ0211022.1 peptide chain release factor 2 [Hyphomicrobium sp.]
MRAEPQKLVDSIKEALGLLRRHLDWDTAQQRLAELNKRAEDPSLWNDPKAAQKVMRQRQQLERSITAYEELQRGLDDGVTLIELGEAEDDDASVAEGEAMLKKLDEEAQRRSVEALLSGEADGNDAYLEVHAGAGGTESQDWASMLARMYMRWAEQRGYKVSTLEESPGEEAGIKSVTMEIKGDGAYGWLKTESGVHRLVRISPYDANARRHTSFASVWVYPVIDDDIDIEIKESDCRVDTYRSSGAGGQHVNTTDSAVRITHIPTGIAVASQQERSQIKNRAIAWAMLKSRLYELELKKREEKANAEAASKTDIGWGHQIRSYVLQPYQLVKDLRTGTQSTNPAAVLDGEIDPFIESALAQRIKGGAQVEVADLD